MTDVPVETTVHITVDGKSIEARQGELLIDAAERNGVYIPRFCYHHRMDPVGMCRMCLVEIDSGRGPALQPSCMVPVAPDMVVETESEVAKKAQEGILEFLLINHPLDCPVCDKGGECPLQDHTMAYGPGETRFVEEKRHYEKPIAISDNVFLDRERCILCDRCTRFSKEVAGDTLIHFQDRGNGTQVNTFPNHPFASYFSGNTVQICPVGALTAKPYRFKARPWDLDVVESTCNGCSVGCRIVIDSSRDEILRFNGVDSDPVNWSWLCDKGRFGFEAIKSPQRLVAPLTKQAQGHSEARWVDALAAAAKAIKASIDGAGGASVAVIGGSRLTNEAAYAWTKLSKGVIGTDNVDAQLGDGFPGKFLAALPKATIDEACKVGGTVLAINADPKEEQPVLFLRLRDAVTRRHAHLIELAPVDTSLTSLARTSLRTTPGAVNELVAKIISGDGEFGAIKQRLGAGPFTVLLGRSSVAEGPESTMAAAAALLEAFPDVKFLSGVRRGNVHGAIDVGMAPGLLPGRVSLESSSHLDSHWSTVPATEGLDTAGILAAAAAGKIDTLILLGADPLSDFPDHQLASRALTGARTVIAVDAFMNSSVAQADIVLPAGGFGEVDGTTTNLEGRITAVVQKVTPAGTARADWVIAAELAFLLGADLGVESVDDLWNELSEISPLHSAISLADLAANPDGIVAVVPELPVETEAAESDAESDIESDAESPEISADDAQPGETSGDDGSEATVDAEETLPAPSGVTLQVDPYVAPAVDAYSLRLITIRKLYDQGTMVQQAPSLAGLAAGARVVANPADLDRIGVSEGGRVRLSSARGSIVAAIGVDAKVPAGTIAMAVGQGDPSPGALIDASSPVTDVRVETVS